MALKVCETFSIRLVLLSLLSLAFLLSECDAMILRGREDGLPNHLPSPEDELVEIQKDVKRKAMENIREIFGISSKIYEDPPPRSPHHQSHVIPEFMSDLYNLLSESSGLTRKKIPFNAKVIRSYIEKDNSSSKYFYFNISNLGVSETVLEAQFRLFIMRMPEMGIPLSLMRYPEYQVRLYQVLDKAKLDSPDHQRLLSVDNARPHESAWHVFNVTQAVRSWLSGASPNLGLLISASTITDDVVHPAVARRGTHHGKKQPVLVLFNKEVKGVKEFSMATIHETPSATVPEKESENADLSNGNIDSPMNSENDRTKRSLPANFDSYQYENFHESSSVEITRNVSIVSADVTPRVSTECSLQDLYVNFTELGWGWVVSPYGFDVNYCTGNCDFPLRPTLNPTNHATILSHMYERGHANLGKRCCVPTYLDPVNILLKDDDGSIILKQMDDMIARSCGCR